MTESEREMLRECDRSHAQQHDAASRFTSLQPTYEDTVAPAPDDDWQLED